MNNVGHPQCPYCETELDDEQLWYHENDIEVSVGDGDQSTIICPNDDCKKEYHVVCSFIYDFINVDKDGDEIDDIEDLEDV